MLVNTNQVLIDMDQVAPCWGWTSTIRRKHNVGRLEGRVEEERGGLVGRGQG